MLGHEHGDVLLDTGPLISISFADCVVLRLFRLREAVQSGNERHSLAGSGQNTIQFLESLDSVSAEDKEKLMGLNAVRLFNLKADEKSAVAAASSGAGVRA